MVTYTLVAVVMWHGMLMSTYSREFYTPEACAAQGSTLPRYFTNGYRYDWRCLRTKTH